jgi:hypothetical protein
MLEQPIVHSKTQDTGWLFSTCQMDLKISALPWGMLSSTERLATPALKVN